MLGAILSVVGKISETAVKTASRLASAGSGSNSTSETASSTWMGVVNPRGIANIATTVAKAALKTAGKAAITSGYMAASSIVNAAQHRESMNPFENYKRASSAYQGDLLKLTVIKDSVVGTGQSLLETGDRIHRAVDKTYAESLHAADENTYLVASQNKIREDMYISMMKGGASHKESDYIAKNLVSPQLQTLQNKILQNNDKISAYHERTQRVIASWGLKDIESGARGEYF